MNKHENFTVPYTDFIDIPSYNDPDEKEYKITPRKGLTAKAWAKKKRAYKNKKRGHKNGRN